MIKFTVYEGNQIMGSDCHHQLNLNVPFHHHRQLLFISIVHLGEQHQQYSQKPFKAFERKPSIVHTNFLSLIFRFWGVSYAFWGFSDIL